MNNNHHHLVARRVQSGASLLLIALTVFTLLFIPRSAVHAQSGDVGYPDFTFPSGTGGDSQATGEKPESKLWWNDGAWYGCLWSRTGNAYHIFLLDTATQNWTDTGVAIDDRPGSKADVLWDGSKLYVVSHIYDVAGAPASAGQRGELFRFSYNTTHKTYSLDNGFPVEVTRGISETLVIDKDSNGQLWVTYVESNTVMVNHSLNGNDLTWGQPYALPAGGAEKVSSDDISSIITYNQQVGIMWSSQLTSPTTQNTMYFAVHPANSPDTNWTRVRAYGVSGDDHINLKTLQSDNAGNVFAVIKTARSSAIIMVLVCKNNVNRCKTEADWTPYVVYDSIVYNPTRPSMLIDETNRQIYVFTRNEDSDGSLNGGIYYKRANLDNISFPSGKGTAFIRTTQDVKANDVTSTKQNVNSTTGLLVLASDHVSKMYLHNYLILEGAQPSNQPIISGFSPASGLAGTEVTLTGNNLIGVTQVAFNGLPAASFTVDSNTQLRAVVPGGASSGPITVKTPSGTGTSPNSFTVTAPPFAITAFTPASGPVGTVVTLTGSGLTKVTGVTFNGKSAQTYTVISDLQVTAVVPNGATNGPITVKSATGNATSSGPFTVTQPGQEPNYLYLSLIRQNQ